MSLDGFIGNVEPLGDFLIAKAVTDQFSDLTLTGSQAAEVVIRWGRIYSLAFGDRSKFCEKVRDYFTLYPNLPFLHNIHGLAKKEAVDTGITITLHARLEGAYCLFLIRRIG